MDLHESHTGLYMILHWFAAVAHQLRIGICALCLDVNASVSYRSCVNATLFCIGFAMVFCRVLVLDPQTQDMPLNAWGERQNEPPLCTTQLEIYRWLRRLRLQLVTVLT